ncbi:MAG TPA: DNA topoisomerase IV subunit A, partial [Spirochaetales bacterium]|nr:DNA topoisomerase IV subunit A [Spirochaetales bacterium]
LGILKKELELEIRELLDDIHARTLERIFIEERVYKAIENKKTQEAVNKAVFDGLKPFAQEIKRDVSLEDIERLLKIPIRRISLYDIEKARAEMDRLKAKLKEARHHLAHLVDYGIACLESIAAKLKDNWKRKTVVESFEKVDMKEAAKRDIAIRYDRQAGYVGSSVSGGEFLFNASPFDRLLVIRRNAIYSVVDLPERLFVDKDMAYCAIADKDALSSVVFTVVYKDSKNGSAYIKRCTIEAWINNKDYQLIPENSQLLWFTAEPRKAFSLHYAAKARLRKDHETFRVEDYPTKGLKALGVRLSTKEATEVLGLDDSNLFDAVETKKRASAAQKADASPKTKATATAERTTKAARGTKPSKAAATKKASKSTVATSAGTAKKTAKKPEAPAKDAATGKASGGLLDKANKKRKG